MKKSTRIASYIAIFGIIFSTGLLIGNSLPTHSISAQSMNNGETLSSILSNSEKLRQLNMKPLWTVKGILESKYLDDEKLKATDMSYGAVKGMVESLKDPHTEFMDPQDTKDFNEILNSELEGIGAELSIRDKLLTVVNTVKSSPAEKNGLQPNDVIIQINEKTTLDMPLLDAIKLIRGPKGTEVTLTIIREGKDKPFEVTLKRETITLSSVTYSEKEGNIWHVEINSFSDDTKIEFIKAMEEIKKKKPKGMILDLRFNGGGYLNGAVDVLSAFIRGETKVVTIEYRDPTLTENLFTDGAPQFPDLPLVVLINGGSASASEIVAAAIQDLKRGLIFGEKSYGKGTVQEVDPLPDGSSLRFTIAKWLSPLGREFNEKGVEPDRVIEFTEEDYKKQYDRQLEEAIKYLKSL